MRVFALIVAKLEYGPVVMVNNVFLSGQIRSNISFYEKMQPFVILNNLWSNYNEVCFENENMRLEQNMWMIQLLRKT